LAFARKLNSLYRMTLDREMAAFHPLDTVSKMVKRLSTRLSRCDRRRPVRRHLSIPTVKGMPMIAKAQTKFSLGQIVAIPGAIDQPARRRPRDSRLQVIRGCLRRY
jgi:hypothetical protein